MGLKYFFPTILVGCLSMTNLVADVGDGASLYEGSTSFKNGGPACVVCHNVDNNRVISGGYLAKDLTKIISAYGGVGAGGTETAKAMISDSANMPSPVMVEAYEGKELTESEVKDLVDFLINADSKDVNPSNSSVGFVISSIIGAAIIFVLLTFLGKRRKKESVNQKIYDRQLNSTWKDS